MNTFRLSYYQQRIAGFSDTLKNTKKQHGVISLLRLLVFIALMVSWLYIITLQLAVGVILGTTFFIGFLVLLKVHKRLEDKKRYLETMLAINQAEHKSCQGDFSDFNTGEVFIDSEHAYSYDIDLFGVGSLFQYVNRTVTNNGKKMLAHWLANTPLPDQKILDNQKAVEELATLSDFRQEFLTIGKLFASDENEEKLIKKWLALPNFFKRHKLAAVSLWLMPFVNVTFLLLMILSVVSWSVLPFVIIGNLTLVGTKLKQFNIHYDYLSKSLVNLKKMTGLLYEVEKQDFAAPLLIQLKSNFYKDGESASKQIRRLTKLLDALDNRNNIILGFLLNAFLLWDWNYLWRIEKWQKSHQLEYANWQKAVAEIDALISLANLYFNNPDFSFPELAHSDYEFKAQKIGHPLLKKDIRVCNNFEITETPRYAIITGANMAGKSTFLRTIATNLVLAGCGSAVCAENMSFSPLPMHTSMRAEDSLMKNESYFFAELKRLQRITQALGKGQKLFIILDEILRGTNSEDKRKGSIGFVKKIAEQHAYGLVATHDLELARLAEQKPKVFKALCFEVSFEKDELQFDYTLQPGVTQNMNASFLMKRMGIID